MVIWIILLIYEIINKYQVDLRSFLNGESSIHLIIVDIHQWDDVAYLDINDSHETSVDIYPCNVRK